MGVAVVPGILLLTGVVIADPFGGRFQGLALLGGQTLKSRFQLRPLHGQIRHGGGVAAVEAVGVLHHRGVAPAGHITQDTAHPLTHFLIALFAPGGERHQAGNEIRVVGV